MAKFKVIQYRDALIRYEVEIDADSPEAALETAKNTDCDWEECGVGQLDNAEMEVRDTDGKELIPIHNVW